MKTIKRRTVKIVSFILSVLIIFGMFPLMVFAADKVPVVEWPTVEPGSVLYVGQKYSTVKLIGGDSGGVDGYFDWGYPDLAPYRAGENSLETVYFYPTDTATYKKTRGKVAVTILKSETATMEGLFSVNPLQAGQKLSEAEFDMSEDFMVKSYDTLYDPVITWENPDKIYDKAGEYQEKVIVSAKDIDASSMNTIEQIVTVTVLGEEDVMVVKQNPSASDIELGQTLGDSILTGGVVTKGETPITGTFAWKDSSIVPELGTTEQTVIFTPDDIANGYPIEIQVAITVNRLFEVTELPVASDIKVGQTLVDSVLTGGKVMKGNVEIPGTFVWKDLTISPKTVGTAKYTVVFTPNDPTACDPIETQVSVTVGKGAPEITAWPIAKGQYKVGGYVNRCVTLEGGKANIPGEFRITEESKYTRIPDSITESMDIELVFIPKDTANYENAYKTVTVSFDPADPDCRAEHFISSDGKSFEIRGRIANDENWSIHTGNFYLYLDGEKIELTEPDRKFKYDISTLSAGEHTIYSEYIPGENDVYAHDTSDTVTFNVNAFYAVNVTDSTGTKTLDSYLPGKTVTVTAEPHAKSYYDFTGWTAEGITLTEEEAAQQKISFTMPENEVNLTANYKFNFCNFVKAVFEKIGQVLLGIITEGIAWLKDAIQNIPRP